ncbi:response regulator receiver protein [Thermosinus carboxydivorans Nor1]|uniref:Response regulator receiver protein n=1 Tax=Thermosinus carboxydivorans Nor1 TaxID=401526 RepID=A1HP78_9FIRM|nr:response regulator [Thermosinus carboxydivorans]EAX48186.1 response regulator receiver protein [Thermosinus carboxydivorans Nor1]
MNVSFVVVDDDVSVRKIIQHIINEYELGKVVAECGDGIAAEKIIRDVRPHIALVDLLLPKQDGIELIRKLAADRLDTSFIMISQVNSEPMITRAYECGIEFFIHKPINVLEVVSVINRVKESRRLRQFVSIIQQTASQYSVALKSAEQPKNNLKTNVYRIFSDIGIIGEAGAKDIYQIVELVDAWSEGTANYCYQLSDVYSKLSAKTQQDAKTIEQRVRRTIAKALQNLANLGIEDYYNEKFQNYSTVLFDFKEVRQEINFINGKSTYRGKINVKKFIEGLIFAAKLN